MARHNYEKLQAFTTAATFAAAKHHLVVLSAEETVDIAGAGENAIGVNIHAALAGETTGVMCAPGDIVEVVVGAAVAAGAKIMSNASGRAITATATNHVLGVALEAGAANGDLISIMWLPQGILAA